MIVVVGPVHAQRRGGEIVPGGLAAGIAVAAAASGRPVELVSRLGDDPAGDAVLLRLARAGVRHVATLRDAGRATAVSAAADDEADLVDPVAEDPEDAQAADRSTTDAAPTLDREDLGLALRYLPEIGVIVLVHPAGRDVINEAVDGARYAGAHLVLVAPPDQARPEGPPEAALVIVAPRDAEGVGALIGRYAAAVDGGATPAEAFAGTLGAES